MWNNDNANDSVDFDIGKYSINFNMAKILLHIDVNFAVIFYSG